MSGDKGEEMTDRLRDAGGGIPHDQASSENDDRALRERAWGDDDSTAQELIARYLAGVALLRDTVAGMDESQLHARPIAGKMSTQEVVGHIVDSDRFMAERMKRTIAGDDPLVMGAKGAHRPESPSNAERDLALDLQLLQTTREQTAEDLRPLAPEVWERVAMRRDDSAVTLRQLLLHQVRHLENHVGSIKEKRAALGL
jgi:uncharacterized damage-inducible protein DinB